ncbi:hypothetical protein KC480_05155 [Bacillus velezensis]|uniref:hypothetical protein n=1 Tax=Bacillus velezensis TaxID=492670 RepID=UPI001E2FF7F2|nr:hypothetical protein [Bacillus velezensis]MCD7910912.1 hypothetical protein [Bacillus velezensis]
MELTSQYCKVSNRRRNNVSFYERMYEKIQKLDLQYPYLTPRKSSRTYLNTCYSLDLIDRFPPLEQREQGTLDGELYLHQLESQTWANLISGMAKNMDQRIMQMLDGTSAQPTIRSSTKENERGER